MNCIHCRRSLHDGRCIGGSCIVFGLEQTEDDILTLQEYRRAEIVRRAVEKADRIIMDNTDGSAEETDWLTAAVASRFMEKIMGRSGCQLLGKDINARARERSKVLEDNSNACSVA